MITVTYDPLHSVSVPDGLSMAVAESIVKDGNDVTIGTGLVIDAIRVLVKTGKISHSIIHFKYKDTYIAIDKYAKLSSHPIGFNDTMDGYMDQLLDWHENHTLFK
jgi:hypothetical protein